MSGVTPPEPETAHRAWHRDRAHDDFGLGAVQLVRTGSPAK
ncbi:hypothetical protein SRB17_15420 [Streptomyces sp. RB17]|nr:hypothetical protein [Streptomyces sp. RB17]